MKGSIATKSIGIILIFMFIIGTIGIILNASIQEEIKSILKYIVVVLMIVLFIVLFS